jgi:peptidoglycan/xylan/chitin deacetylase (PgdA/CDA1 family)
MTHPDLHRVSAPRLREEVKQCQSVLQDIIGAPVISFRAPYGNFRWDLRDVVQFGLKHLVGWDVDPHADAETRPSTYSDRIQRYTTDRSIVLLHVYFFNVEQETAKKMVRALTASLELFIHSDSRKKHPIQNRLTGTGRH